MDAKISHSGLLARSPEGHAARGMQIKGNEELWVEIQANTFRNWVNENLPTNMRVADLAADLCSGVRLCVLVETLQGKPIKPAWNKRPVNQHHYLENVTAALNAIEQDGVKLVNIGNVDIVNGNLKLILGLIWSLIVRYQIGRSKFPPRKLMLAWLQAVLPECKVSNLTTDWNSGVLLSALVDYCQPGLFPHWKSLHKNDSVENCRKAMSIAQKDLGIPAVLEPEYLASPWLDELSGMTYLSYFMKPGSPGFHATLRWVNSRMPRDVKNFTSDWNDGRVICEIVKSLGGSAPTPEKLRTDPSHWEDNLNQALNAGKKLGVQPILSARDLADKNVEHLGVMAYAAHFQWIPERPPLYDLIVVRLESTSGRVGEPTHFFIELLDRELSYSALSAEIRAPDNKIYSTKLKNGNGSFVAQKVGMHEIIVMYNGEEVSNGHYFRVLPPMVEVAPPGMAPCALGSIVQVLVNATGAPKTEDIRVTAYSPHNRALKCPLTTIDGTNTASFKPDEPGEWRIEITYQGKQIQGGPFTCSVFDPNGVHISGLNGALPLVPHVLDVDTNAVGVPGELHVDVVHDKKSIHSRIERVGKTGFDYRLHFTPKQAGKHRVYVYFNGYDVRGSPFMMRVGTQKGKKSSSNSPITTSSYRQSPTSGLNHSTNRLNTPSPVFNYHSSANVHSANSLFNSNKSQANVGSSVSYRQSASPVYGETKFTNTSDYHKMSTAEKRISSSASPSFMERQSSPSLLENKRMQSPSLMEKQRMQSPSLMEKQRMQSPSFMEKQRMQSPSLLEKQRMHSPSFGSSEHLTTKKISERRMYESSSPSFIKQTEYHDYNNKASIYDQEASYTNKMSSIRISDSRSPVFMDRSSPNLNYGGSRFDKHATETKSYNTRSFDTSDGVDTTPLIKVSAMSDRASARRDSWDAIAKTRNILSHRSLESVANLADSQLDSKMQHDSSHKYQLDSKMQHDSSHKYQLDSKMQHDSSHKYQLDSKMQHDSSHRYQLDSKIQHDSSHKYQLDSKLQHDPSHKYQLDSKLQHDPSHKYQLDSKLQHDPSHKYQLDSKLQHDPSHKYQLDTDLRHDSSHKYSEEHSNYVTRDQTYSQHGERVYQSQLQTTRPAGARGGGASAVKVQPVPDGVLGQPVEFEIDGSGAGSGDLEILVEGGRVTSSVRSLGGQRFKAAFTPHQALPHRVDIRFNGDTVPGSPWHVNIMSGSSLSVLGESTRLVPANSPAVFEIITSTSLTPDELTVHVISPSKRIVPSRVLPGNRSGIQQVEFVPTEVGTHVVEVAINGEKLAAGPLIAKVYDAGLIQVADVSGGVVGQPVQFRVDASQAGEGQLEISINEGEVPNHVQVVGGGRCLVSFTPDQAKPHLIDIKFNGETVRGCPFVCSVADTSRVTLSLGHLELIPVNQPSSFHMGVAGGGAAELAVAVRGPSGELPVKVTGDIHAGFTAEFTPSHVGAHQINVDYNGRPVQGTPFVAKAFDATRVTVGTVARGTVGRPVTFSVDASEAGEGNLEITISARGLNIPTQVHPQGNARFAVSFVPAEACDHVVSVAFNKRPVVGCPLIVGVGGGGAGPSVTLPGPGPVHRASTLLINHPGRLEDIEVNVEGPGGQAVPTQVQPLGNGQFRAEFVPRAVGEHRISVSVSEAPTAGSPYSAKVYDVQAIKVKESPTGVVGKPVTFLVETSQAGPGNLEVTVNGGRVPTSAQAQGAHTYAISFTPREATPHTVDLRFNGQDVPGSPFQCTVAPAARIMAPETLDKVSVGRPCQFAVESPTAPTVEVLGPARRSLQVQVAPQIANPGKFDVTFTPLDVGDHSVEVRLGSGGGHVEGSPFLIKAYDANRVSVTDITDGLVGKPVSFSINASQAGAGNLEIIVAVNGRNVPNFVQSEGNARFKVNFKPTEAATHSLSVRFNGQAVPGSPFACKVSPGNTQPRLPVSGNGIELAAVGVPAEIKLEGVTGFDPQIIVTAPTGKVLQTKHSVHADTLTAHFTPENVGRHSVAILIADQHVIGSPFSCNVYDVSKVIVSGLPGRKDTLSRSMSDLSLREHGPAEVGKAVTFSVDAAQAGEGTLELVVSTQHTTVKAEVVACARGLYDVTFVPQTSEDHFVNITFNDMSVVGSPFMCSVIEATQYIQTGSLASVDLPSESHHLEITDPNGQNLTYTMKNLKAEFPASQIGTYRVHIMRGNEIIAAKTMHVFDSSKIEVTSAPEAVCHRPAVVSINLKNAGPGKLSATVKVGNKDIAHSVRQNSSNPNLWEVVFHPVNVAPHRLTLLFNGVPKPGVLEVPVRAPGTEPWAGGLGLYQARVSKVTAFTIDTLGRPAREFDVVVSSPTGAALPVRCYQTKTGRLQAEFTAQEIGPHRVEVLHQAKPLAGSPYVCQAFDAELVRLSEVPRDHGNVGERITFTLNAREAGLAELEIVATSPLGQTLPMQIIALDEFTQQISFLPSVPGLYQLVLSYGGVPVHGSPLGFAVGPMGPQPPPRAVGPGLESAQVGERTSFTVSSFIQPRVQIEAVEGSIESHMQCPKPGEYIISYTPLWVGTYDIVISCGSQQLAGSPFQPTVVDPASIRVIGGISQYMDDTGRLKLPCKVAFDVSNAGPGIIECVIAGRKMTGEKSGGRIRLDLSAEGLSAGEHDLSIAFANVILSDIPHTAVSLGDQVILTGRGLAQAQCGEPATFNIDGSRAGHGNPEVTLHAAESNLPIPVMLSLAGDKMWRAQYTIMTPGSYFLSVLWAGRPVKGCPLTVEARGGADASKVLCSGEGLRQGVVGREIRSWIDTRRAGPGELTAHCTGPRKVAYCELYDHGDATFTLNVKPQEAGRHALTIKYAGQHVTGSPFVLRVAGAPDASKVRVYGPGIEHGVLATFQSRFICDTRGAGAGQLTVRVRGPKGAFRVEMQRESQKDRTILCKYDPTEPGDYRVEVKWAGELVPGSPFPVMIFDTQEELRRYLNSL